MDDASRRNVTASNLLSHVACATAAIDRAKAEARASTMSPRVASPPPPSRGARNWSKRSV